MYRSSSTSLRLAVVATLIASLLVPVGGALAQESPEPPVAAPTITGPHQGCGAGFVDEGGDTITFGGTATPGSAIATAIIRQFDANGAAVGSDRNVIDSIALNAQGQFSGSALAPADPSATAASLKLLVTVTKDELTSAVGGSNALLVDRRIPSIKNAATTSDKTIRVTFTETVLHPDGDSPLQWFIRGDQALKPLSVTGAGDTRILRFEHLTFGVDERPQLNYRTYTRPAYHDCVGHDIDATNRISNTLDRILPPVPTIEAINGSDASLDDRAAGTNPTPHVRIGGLDPGYSAELWAESNGETGFQTTDTFIDDDVATEEEVAIPAPALGSDGEYVYYARAVDLNGNISDGADGALYKLDRVAPKAREAHTAGDTITVVFEEDIARGRNSGEDWEIEFIGAGGLPVTRNPSTVEGEGDVRLLHFDDPVPIGSDVSYFRPDVDGYEDEAGNPLASFTSEPIAALIPKVVDVDPETFTQNARDRHTLTATVSNDAGATVPGALVSLRVFDGPNSSRNIDGDPNTPPGVIGRCFSGGDGACSIPYISPDLGTDRIQGWIGALDPAPLPEGDLDQPGQDVVEVHWTYPHADLILDVSPETANGPVGQPHVAAVKVTALDDEDPLAAATEIGGVNVDAQVVDGPNHGHVGECQTNSEGVCSLAYDSTIAGTDRIQYWIDSDDDDTTVEELFLDRAEERDADASPIPKAGNDPAQDVAQKSWLGVVIPVLQVEPEDSQSLVGGTRSLRFITTDGATSGIAGLKVRARVLSGPNQGLELGSCTTSGTGDCTIHSYASQAVGIDLILGWIDSNNNGIADEITQFEPRSESSTDDEPDQDVVQAQWAPGGGGDGGTTPSPDPSPPPSPSPSPGGGSGGSGGGGSGGGSGGGGSGGELGTRSLSVATSNSQVAFRRAVTISGDVEASPGCVPGSLQLRRSIAGGPFESFMSVTVQNDRSWAVTLHPEKSARYRAQVPGSTTCSDASSARVSVLVQARVKARAVDRSIEEGDCTEIRGLLSPAKLGETVYLQKRVSSGWKDVRSGTVSDGSKFAFAVCPSKTKRYRMRWSGDEENLASISRSVRIRVVL